MDGRTSHTFIVGNRHGADDRDDEKLTNEYGLRLQSGGQQSSESVTSLMKGRSSICSQDGRQED